MRVFIGGSAVLVPARWYFAPKGALEFSSPHGAEASPYLQLGESNNDWGEVTPYPQDPSSAVYRGLDRGKNAGYAGRCFVGDPQWFIDGQLPSDILSRVPAPLPSCCKPPLVVPLGGIVLGGAALFPPPPKICPGCPMGVAPNYQVTIAGGTGTFAIYNGVWLCAPSPIFQCVWQTFGTFVGVQVGLALAGAGLNLFSLPGFGTAHYVPVGAFGCKTPTTWALSSSSGAGTPPTSVVSVPA